MTISWSTDRKLHAYGFDISFLCLLHNYLTNRKQRVKIDRTFSSWEKILFGVPQGSILRSLLFHIFLYGLFLIIKNPKKIIKVLEHTSVDLLTWFKNNGMKANADKSPSTCKFKRESVC